MTSYSKVISTRERLADAHKEGNEGKKPQLLERLILQIDNYREDVPEKLRNSYPFLECVDIWYKEAKEELTKYNRT